jgi:hypothetical protein
MTSKEKGVLARVWSVFTRTIQAVEAIGPYCIVKIDLKRKHLNSGQDLLKEKY